MSFAVVIPSARAANLVPCVQALRANEPDLPGDRIVVVDDGARVEAEPHLPGLRWVSGQAPFVFARNANLGIQAAQTDVVLLNDDARLLTAGGLSQLVAQARQDPGLGVVSAGIRGVIGNPRQLATGVPRLRLEPSTLAFVCVFLAWDVYRRVGPLDERFIGYGFEDNDYCARLVASGLRLGIWDGCVVDHSGALPSTFRTRPDVVRLSEHNRRLFEAKWRHGQSTPPTRDDRPGLVRLNLGFAEGPLANYTNADTLPMDGIAPTDLRQRWPWADDSVEHVRAWDIVEHLPDKIHTMNELWRVLAADGTVEIAVPTTDGPGAWQDPTHVSFWNRRSFLYYEDGNPYRERFARHYGILARFRTVAERVEPTPDGPRLTIMLRAVKS